MKIIDFCRFLKKSFFPSPVDLWFKHEGDDTLRLDYNLNEKSIVFDCGGYEGEWAQKIFNKYSCTIYVFEPVRKYYLNIRKKFRYNSKIKVFNFGLASKDKKVKIYLDKNSSSIIKKSGKLEDIKLVDFARFINDKKINKIDLIKINIEGAEYDLVNYLISSNLVNIINNIQVQFHRFVENSEINRKNIQNDLFKSHYLTYNYDFVWENWAKKLN